jgi:hypothetical protein
MITNFGLFHGGSLGRHLWCLLLSICVFCFLTPDVNAHGGSGGSGGSGSGSGSSGSGGHGGPGGSMGGSSAAPGGFTGGGPSSSGSGHGGTGHGGTGHGSGHASSSTGGHGTVVAHSTTMSAAKNSTTHNQAMRNGFTSDTMLQHSPDRIRSRQITSTGGFAPETYRRKKLKTNNALATKNATQNSTAHQGGGSAE